MVTVKEAASAFLAKKRIAVTGLSRKADGHGSNAVYKRLRDRGYETIGVDLSELRKAGGGPKCCTLRLRQGKAST